MGRMNLGRVLLGGIVAGIVIDLWEGVMRGVIFQSRGAELMALLGKSADVSPKQLIAFNVWGIVVGILTIWLYAAIRPRLGPGPKTAVIAGLFAWLLVFAFGVMPIVFTHILPVDFAMITVSAEAVMMIIAGLAGGALYKEST
jgi:hypothetical protein